MTTNPRQLVPDPAVARCPLGIRLRELREQRSLRLQDIAASLQLALSRIETKAPTSRHYLASLLDAYGATDPQLRQQLEALAHEGQLKPWWAGHNGLLPDGTGRYLGMEAAATLVCSYATQVRDLFRHAAAIHAAAIHPAPSPGLPRSPDTRPAASVTDGTDQPADSAGSPGIQDNNLRRAND